MKRTVIFLFFFIVMVSLCGCGHNKGNALSMNTPNMATGAMGKASISKMLKDYGHLPIEDRIGLYYQLKGDSLQVYNFENEDELTMYGYGLLWDNKPREALAVFRLIVEQFPNSYNAYDSLGEGYMTLGNKDLAIENYKRSLAMNPDNFNAEDMIERIMFPNKKPLLPTERFAQVFTVKQYRDDLDQLGKRLLEVHPNATKFITEDAFWKVIEAKNALITKATTYGEFVWHCREIIANVNCSHTSNSDFFTEWELLPSALRFPLEVQWINDSLVVVDAGSNTDRVRVREVITGINGVRIDQLMGDIYRHIPSQGHVETYKRYRFNAWAPAMIAYGLGFPERYEVTLQGKAKRIALKPYEKTVEFKESAPRTRGDNLCLEFLPDGRSAVLTIASFNYYPWNNLDVFEAFIDGSFMEMEKKGIGNLIIDLRFNGGGSPEASLYLLKHLVKKPFVYFLDSSHAAGAEFHKPIENEFKGKLYFLIDGNGNSTTGHFMAIAKYLNLGIIVGEELGSNQFCTAGQTVCRLTNTKFEYYIANTTSEVMVQGLPDDRGIFPDFEVHPSIEEFLDNVDVVKEFAIELTKKNNC